LAHFVAITVDGVDYLAGHREELAELLPSDRAPSAEAARAHLTAYLAGLEGRPARMRAGWAAVRWAAGDDPDALAWRGPAYLFSFEAPVVGQFALTFTGEDPSEWPPP